MLPIYDIQSSLLDAAKRCRRILITAPTGSGKSTQIPQMLLDLNLLGPTGRVVVLQPRRLATRMLAARVAKERHTELGSEVGYQIRFENHSSPDTRIHFETEGILLRQMISDPMLSGVSAIIFDEFHERHVYGDVTLSQALELQRKHRPDLLLIVMSATLQTRFLEEHMAPCEVLTAEGRAFPVDVEYLPKPLHPTRDTPWDAATAVFEQASRQGRVNGDTLIFMPGAYEIQRTIESLRLSSFTKGKLILPLHGELPTADQDAAVAQYDAPKIIVSTNVAETSLTIDGIRLVIDSGLARVARYDPWRGINTLHVEHISQASADQRTGRAGRTAPGVAIRLWTEIEQSQRALQDVPEIKRIDPSEIILTLKSMGFHSMETYPWIDPPDAKALEKAETLLRDLGALDADGKPTPLGLRMLSFPVHPRYSRMLLEAEKWKAVRPIALIAALAQGRPVLIRNPGRHIEENRRDLFGTGTHSDLLIQMRAWNFAHRNQYRVDACRKMGIHAASARQVTPLWQYFLQLAKAQHLPIENSPPEDADIAKCILAGFSDQIARRLDKGSLRCQLVHGRRGELARESAADSCDLLVANEISEIGRGDGDIRTLLTQATGIEEEWLQELYPEDIVSSVSTQWDRTAKRVVAYQELCFRDLPLQSKLLDKPPPDKAAEMLTDAVLSGDCTLKLWNHTVEQWILRTNQLAAACPDWQLPVYDEDARRDIIQQICFGAVSQKDIKERPVMDAVRHWLSPAQQALVQQHMPERVTLKNGKNIKIQYSGDATPYVAARIQEIFDVEELPTIGGGRIPLTIQILAPSSRPVQITKDLKGFWREHYPRIKQELSRKYPKHRWP